ncbi:MAG: CBS domain-containing protein [Erysipelotrichaceae bacterium]|nr:CBS domain-containing protein [Erysipelotrichaceae bacterium]
MNILFFLKPKATVTVLTTDCTLRQALEIMDKSGYTAVPLIDEDGKYVGTISEGDFLWFFKSLGIFNIKDAEKVSIKAINRRRDNLPIRIDEDMSNLINMSKTENFIPVVDDRDVFIGIVTRQDIIDYFLKNNNIK